MSCQSVFFRRMNQELEAKTANLVREAEEMLVSDFSRYV